MATWQPKLAPISGSLGYILIIPLPTRDRIHLLVYYIPLATILLSQVTMVLVYIGITPQWHGLPSYKDMENLVLLTHSFIYGKTVLSEDIYNTEQHGHACQVVSHSNPKKTTSMCCESDFLTFQLHPQACTHPHLNVMNWELPLSSWCEVSITLTVNTLLIMVNSSYSINQNFFEKPLRCFMECTIVQCGGSLGNTRYQSWKVSCPASQIPTDIRIRVMTEFL